MFALCDQRCFYASCERIFRPDLRDKPVAVASNNDGCIVTLSPEAAACGLEKFKPVFKQKALIRKHNITVFSSNYELYGEVSRRIMADLEAEVPLMEIYSIDEAFCDFTGIADPKEFAQHLRKKVWHNQRIPMGVSVGPTKTLSKLGQYATKKIPRLQGVCVLSEPHQWQWLAARVRVNEVWGVGRKLTTKLLDRGIESALDLAMMSPTAARKLAGVTLERTVRELQGVACMEMDAEFFDKQQIISSRSFGSKVSSLPLLLQAVSAHAERASQKLRRQGSYAGRLSVWIETSRFSSNVAGDSQSVSLPGGSSDPCRLSREAVAVTRRLFVPGLKYAKAGVVLMDIRPVECWQGDLLAELESPQRSGLCAAMDAVNERFGRQSIKVARHVSAAGWGMRRESLSPNYLGSLAEAVRLSC